MTGGRDASDARSDSGADALRGGFDGKGRVMRMIGRMSRSRVLALFGAALALVAALGVAGCSSSSNATPTPAAASLAAPLVIQADTVQGSKNLTTAQQATQSCVEENRFDHNAEVIFRAKVIDPVTGKSLDASGLKSVVVELPNGNNVTLKFGQHPASNPTDSFWAGSWTVPADYPSGSVAWKVVATGLNGETATYQPFAVAPSQMIITDQTLTPTGS